MARVTDNPALSLAALGRWLTFWLFFALTIFNPLPVRANNWPAMADIVFRHITQAQGLPHQVVTAVAQSGDGFIWIGTENGLARWDGYRVRTYHAEPGKPNALTNNLITKLHADLKGQLWVLMNNGSMVRYDARLDQFIPIAGWASIHGLRISSMINDDHGDLLLGTNYGMAHVTENAAKIKWHRASSPSGSDLPGKALPGDAITALERDQQGRLWVGTEQGLWLRSSPHAALQRITFPGTQSASARISLLKRLQDGRMIAITTEHGVWIIDPKKSVAKRLPVAPEQQQWLSGLRFVRILETLPNQLWLASINQGLVHIDLKTGQTRRLRHDPAIVGSLAGDTLYDLMFDRQGLLWVATQRGLSWHDTGQRAVLSLFGNPAMKNRISGMDVRSILVQAPDKILLGLSGQGVNLLNPEKQTITPWAPGVAGRMVQSICAGPGGELYFGTDAGVIRTNSQGEQSVAIPFGDLPFRHQSGVLRYFEHRLWVGSVDGLWQLDPARPDPKLVRVVGTEALKNMTIRALEWDGKGGLWIGTNSAGLYHFNLKQQHLQAIPLQPVPKVAGFTFIAHFLIDPKGRLWVAAQGDGIAVLPDARSPKTQGVQFIGTAQGLHNLMISRLQQDENQKIWASTDDGLAQIDPVGMKARPLRQAEGVFINTYWTGSGDKTAQGDLLFGGSGGITLVRPGQMQEMRAFPPVRLSHVVLGGVETWVVPDPASALPGALTIRPKANSLAVEFAGLDFVAPDQINYAYQLEGYDDDWINTPVTRRLASYTNLPPGDYRLHLRASNRRGEWSEHSLVLPLTVLPHWWQTWWMRLIFTLLVLSLALALLQARTSWLRQRQIELEREVATRTTELHQKQDELVQTNRLLNQSNLDLAESMAYLRDAQAKIVQQEKLASIGTLTAGISHEINNPSNFAHVGAYNLGTDLAELHQFLLHLAGDEAPPELIQALEQRFEKLHQSLDAVSEGTTRIRDLVLDLRTFSRLGETDWVVAALADSLRATVHLVSTQFAGDVEIRLDLSVNPELLCWPAQLNQVFMNLIVNACQAMMARPPELRASQPGLLRITSQIEVGLEGNAEVAGKSGYLRLDFADNGPGIAPEIVERIFDPFFTTKTVGEGMGMGLSISHGIIEKHQGSITVQSELGVGTCFTLRLPLSRPK
jgi:signal transduction histidine kinase/ligand-binding sensor domain-containing protein